MHIEVDRREYLAFSFMERIFKLLSLNYSIPRKTMYSVLSEVSGELFFDNFGWEKQNSEETRILKRINRILVKYSTQHDVNTKTPVIAQNKVYDFAFNKLGEIQSKYCLALDIQKDKYARFIKEMNSNIIYSDSNTGDEIVDRNGVNIYECIMLSILYPTLRSRSLNVIDNTAKSESAYTSWVARVNDLIASRGLINSIILTFFDSCYDVLKSEADEVYEILMRKFWLIEKFRDRDSLELAVEHPYSRYDKINFPHDKFTDKDILFFNEVNERYDFTNRFSEKFIPLIHLMLNQELPILKCKDSDFFSYDKRQLKTVNCFDDITSDIIVDTGITEDDYLLASKLAVNINEYIYEAIEGVITVILRLLDRKGFYFDNKSFCIKKSE